MKKKIYLLLLLAFSATFLLTAYSGDDSDYPSGSPAGYSGSPGDGQDCHNCHGGSVGTVSGWITSDIPASGYVPGTTYNITVTVTGSGGHGFEVSPQNPTGSFLGTLIAGSNSHLVGSGNHWITQNQKINSNPATWTFQWTAPVAGSGPVTFYGAFTVTKSNTKLSTLLVNENMTLSANATATPSVICIGQNTQLDVTATGGSGTFTYSWTSIPAGFTANIHNPTATPSVTTKYIASVNDGTNTVTDTVQVDVTPVPIVNAGNDTMVCIGDPEIVLQGIATNFLSISWLSSGTGTFSDPTSLTTSYYPTSADFNAGFVNLYLTAAPLAPCSGTVSDGKHVTFVVCDGINDKSSLQFDISPNPSNGNFVVKFAKPLSARAQVSLHDFNGKSVFTTDVESGNQSKAMNAGNVSAGIYLLKCSMKGAVVTKKVVIF
jgi:hypothetical protein